jgi:glutamine synthetase
LDVKTPLLRSAAALSAQALRLLRLLGDDTTEFVQTTLGAEQEFFVVDRSFYAARPDLLFAGRTLFGAKPPKGQELEDHYFATIPSRVLAFVEEVESELWRLGVPTRARHNEVAPGQHEMAPVFEFSNLASDHNMIQMALLKEVAARHGLACLLHEKPFANVNGSGKHNNWSMCTDKGLNLLDPSATPRSNLLFQCFLSCILHAVDTHADLLRASIATPGNDWRLGMAEAPPAIMSVYLGADILELVDWINTLDPKRAQHDSQENPDFPYVHLGKAAVAPFRRDRTDRNRTSPFAFTGNKFEFRAVGSSQNVGHVVTVLNTIVADSIRTFSDELEAVLPTAPSLQAATVIMNQKFLKKHSRIIFEGNGYSQEWVEEAARRGLPNLPETVEALTGFNTKKNIDLFQSLGVLKPEETHARYNIYLEHYVHTLNIEANVMISMVNGNIVPFALKYSKHIADSISAVEAVLGKDEQNPQRQLLATIQSNLNQLILANQLLSNTLATRPASFEHHKNEAEWVRDQMKPKMIAIRSLVDALEGLIEDQSWTLPKYSDLLFLK